MSDSPSGFARALSRLREGGVAFVVVGVGGINFYARTPADAVATLDVDALLAPVAENLALALRILSDLGYEFEAGGEPFVDLDDSAVLRRVVESGANISAIHVADGEIDLMTSLSGFSYAEMLEDAAIFEVAGASVQVGRLEKLLKSKEMSGRPKDVEFLRAFRARQSED